jgi:hypothetical protein
MEHCETAKYIMLWKGQIFDYLRKCHLFFKKHNFEHCECSFRYVKSGSKVPRFYLNENNSLLVICLVFYLISFQFIPSGGDC